MVENKNTTAFWINKIVKDAKLQEKTRIIARLSKEDVYNSQVAFAIEQLDKDDALSEKPKGVYIEDAQHLTPEGIKKICENHNAKSENKETKPPTHKEFQKAIDKSGLRGYEFKESSEVKND